MSDFSAPPDRERQQCLPPAAQPLMTPSQPEAVSPLQSGPACFQAPLATGPATAAAASPFCGMYDDGVPNHSSLPLELANMSPLHPTPEQLAKYKEAQKKQKNVAKIQTMIGEAQKLEDEAKKLEAGGDKAGAQKKRREAAQIKQSAIDKAITTYKIDVSNAESVTYDPKLTGDGVTGYSKDGKKGVIRIGDEAFSSPGWLGSTIGHESEVHVNRQMMKGNWYTGDIGTALQEVESYQYELDNVDRYGTSKTDQKNLEQRRRSHFDALPSDYQQRATNGDYTMKEGDEEK